MSTNPFGLATSDLATNPTKRTPCVLLLDTSGSMGELQGGMGKPIDLLNRALPTLQSDLLADSTASISVELAIVTFGGSPKEVVPFTPVSSFFPPVLSAAGGTPLGQAVIIALDMIERRKQEYTANGIVYFRPWIFILTDGQPTDSSSDWSDATQRAALARQQKKVEIWALSTDGSPTVISKLQQITDKAAVLDGFAFRETFKFLSNSLTGLSNSKEGQAVAPAPTPSQITPTPWTQPIQP